MTLRRDPELDHQERRAIVLGRFVAGAHAAEADVERWVADWEARAGALGLRRDSPTYWSAGLRWIAGRRDQPEADAAQLRDVS
jgi:hypothetical protein